MADLNQRMSNMGINESVHASGPAATGPPPKQAYIPPHMRASMGRPAPGPGPAPNPVAAPEHGHSNGVQASRWANGYVLITSSLSSSTKTTSFILNYGLTISCL
jgi:hypothetical protein